MIPGFGLGLNRARGSYYLVASLIFALIKRNTKLQDNHDICGFRDGETNLIATFPHSCKDPNYAVPGRC